MAEALIKRKRVEREREITLRLLEHVAADGSTSQNTFAREIGIAKGLANSYFNRCLQKGLIKLRQAPKQRYLYYLTPNGFAEKARLTAQFLYYSYQFYRDARADLLATMQQARGEGHGRLAILGDGELAEIAAIVSEDAAIELVGFVAEGSARESLAGRPVVGGWRALDRPDAALLAVLEDARQTHDRFRALHPQIALFVPASLAALVWDRAP